MFPWVSAAEGGWLLAVADQQAPSNAGLAAVGPGRFPLLASGLEFANQVPFLTYWAVSKVLVLTVIEMWENTFYLISLLFPQVFHYYSTHMGPTSHKNPILIRVNVNSS